MKTIDFSFNGGFPLDQRTLNDKQTAYLDILYALTGFLRIPAAGNHIMYGCEIVGPNITSGMMYIDGELCTFAGSAGDANTKIKKSIIVENAPFFNGTNNPVYKNSIAVVDPAGVAYSTFTRFGSDLVYDENYTHTDNNFTAALLAKLNGIETLAQRNVIPDYGENDPAAPTYIANKPTDFIKRLEKGIVTIGDVGDGSNTLLPIDFPDVGTDNYIVVGSLVGMNNLTQHGRDNDVTWVARDKTRTSFNLSFDEYSPQNQNLIFNFLLIELV